MQKIIFIALLTGLNYSLFGQQFEQEIKGLLKEKPRFEIKLDSRNSFISSSNVRVFGVKAGIIYGNKLSFGLGYNFLRSKLDQNNYLTEMGPAKAKLYYRYWSPYVEYVFYEDNRWQLSIPVQFGIGSSFYKSDLTADEKLGQKLVMSYEPAITFQYRILRYFSLGAGLGYRLMIINNKNVDERFTSPVYLIKFKFNFQDFYNDVII